MYYALVLDFLCFLSPPPLSLRFAFSRFLPGAAASPAGFAFLTLMVVDSRAFSAGVALASALTCASALEKSAVPSIANLVVSQCNSAHCRKTNSLGHVDAVKVVVARRLSTLSEIVAVGKILLDRLFRSTETAVGIRTLDERRNVWLMKWNVSTK